LPGGGVLRGVAAVLVVAAVEFGLVMVAVVSPPPVALAALAAMVGVAACLIWPVPIMVLAFPAAFFSWRIGPVSANLSLTDAVAGLGLVAALPYVPWRSPLMRRILLGLLGYCLVMSISVVANFNQGAVTGVLHRFEFVAGAVFIGAALANLHKVRTALRWLMVTGVVMSVAAIVDTLTHGLAPAYPFGLQKNGYASLACSCFLVLLFAGRRLDWPREVVVVVGVVLVGGVAASQSRGVGLALAATLLIYALRAVWNGSRAARRALRLAPLLVLVAVVMVGIAAVTYQARDAKLTPDEARFGSVETRVDDYEAAWQHAIRPNPLVGAGPGWFALPGSPYSVPHDIVIAELSEVGALGLLALCWFLWRVLRTSGRTGTDLGQAAWYAVVARILATTVDIFWVAGPTTLPFLLVGLAVGDAPSDGVAPRRPRLASAAR
jgi:hypothetical protein